MRKILERCPSCGEDLEVRALHCTACGTERTMTETELTSWRTPSCGCRPEAEVVAELLSRWKRTVWKKSVDPLKASRRRERKRELDKLWTPQMEQALRMLQPACVVCGESDDLTTDHA